MRAARVLALAALGIVPVDPDATMGEQSAIVRRSAPPSPRGIVITSLDVVVEQAYLQTAPDVGDEVANPALGQVVFFHAGWRTDGLGGPVTVALRAVLDGRVYCGTVFETSGGESGTVWCTDGWQARSGTHTLRWDFDYDDAVPETDETNNSASTTFVTGATPTRTPTRTPTPLPSPTNTVTRTPTATVVFIPTATVTSTARPSPTAMKPSTDTPTRSPTTLSATPTRTPGGAEVRSFFQRGDADCTVRRSAADVVASVRALRGESLCGNDDCDRDGEVSAADVDCTARCLFGECPIPPHAPRVDDVTADSAPGIIGFAAVRVAGTGFGAATVKRVTIGGEDARVADFSPPDTLVAIVPDLPPGPAQVVVYDGQVAGFPAETVVAAAVPIGTRDTFDGTVELLESVIDRFTAFDLDGGYGVNASAVRSALAALNEELERQRDAVAADPDLGPEVRQRLDAAFEASGMPELLRDLLADLEEGGGAQAGAPTVQVVAPRLGQVTRVVGTMARAVGTTLSVPELIGIGTGLLVTAGVVVVALDADALTPLIVEMSFTDSSQTRRELPIGGGSAIVKGARLDALTTGLRVQTAAGEWTQSGENCGEGCLAFPLPNAAGFCGGVILSLTRGPLESNAFVTSIEPQLVDLSATHAVAGEYFLASVRGTVDCATTARFRGFRNGSSKTTSVAFDAVEAQVPEGLPPGSYGVRTVVESVASKEERGLDVPATITDIHIACIPEDLAIPPGRPSQSFCVASPAGEAEVRFPDGTVIEWQSSHPRIASIASTSPTGLTSNIAAAGVGEATITAEAFFTNEDGSQRRRLAGSSEGFVLRVTDQTPPTVSLRPRSPLVVEPGASVEVRVEAEDNLAVSSLGLVASGDAALLPEPEKACVELQARCSRTFTVNFRAGGFTQETVALVAEATDTSGSKGTSERLVYTVHVERGSVSGVVRSQEDDSPLGSAKVELFDAQNQLLEDVTVGTDGRFLFDEVAVGTVRVRASRSGFRAAEQTVQVSDDRTTEVTLRLARLAATALVSGTVEDPFARLFGQGSRYVAGATVTVVDETQTLLGSDVTDANGTYEISELPPGAVIVRADKAGFATSSVHRNLNGFTGLVDFDLYPVNDACSSDLSRFEPLSGHVGIGGSGIRFGVADFDSPLGEVLVRPDAAMVCLSNNSAVPTIDWNAERIHTCCGSFNALVYNLFLYEEGSSSTQLWRVAASTQVPENEIVPPVLYGDQPPGTRRFGDAPDLGSDGTIYRVVVADSFWDLFFRVRP